MTEWETKEDRVYIVGIKPPELSHSQMKRRMEEMKFLLKTLDYAACGQMVCSIRNSRSKYIIGSGKVEEITAAARDLEADLIVLDTDLTPSQERNWEAAAEIPVIDRHRVIIEIFAARASTKEASLQIQLARLEYALPRLKKAWTHLSRQHGGARGTRGEGEQQLEMDRRIISGRIGKLKKELSHLRQSREVKRKHRDRVPVPSGAIVGYTNAGKSSLLNTITEAGVFTENKLFATLDPTTRKAVLPSGTSIVFTDTVGFIRDLPHDLFEAFKSTLEETVYADFLILLLDISDPEVEQHRETTLSVLRELQADDKPIITVYNKVDRLKNMELPPGIKPGIPISAKSGYNIDTLLQEIDKLAAEEKDSIYCEIPSHRYDIAALIHRTGNVEEESYVDDVIRIKAQVPKRTRNIISRFAPGS